MQKQNPWRNNPLFDFLQKSEELQKSKPQEDTYRNSTQAHYRDVYNDPISQQGSNIYQNSSSVQQPSGVKQQDVFRDPRTACKTSGQLTSILKKSSAAQDVNRSAESDVGKRPASESNSNTSDASKAKKSRYEPLEDEDYRLRDSTWECSRCGNTNFEGRNDCVKCTSSREVPMDEDFRYQYSQPGSALSQLKRKRKLFVAGLLSSVTTPDLFKYFSKWGPMDQVVVCTNNEGRSKGFGFVNYINPDDADRCLAEGPHFIHKKELNVQISEGKMKDGDSETSKGLFKHVSKEMEKIRKSQDPTQSNKIRLYVANLSKETTSSQLFCHFVKWGNISAFTRLAGTHLGFVTYARAEDAYRCLADSHMLNNVQLKVEISRKSQRQLDLEGSQNLYTGSGPSQVEDAGLTSGTECLQLDISGLTRNTSSERLLCYFSKFGGIEDCDVEKDTRGRKTGKGFVKFERAADARKALAGCPHVIDRTKVKVTPHQPEEQPVSKPRLITDIDERRRSPSPQMVIPGLNLADMNEGNDAHLDSDSQRKYICKVTGCFFKGTVSQFDRHWLERHEAKVKYLICAFCSMGCVDEDDLVEHLNFFHGVEDKREMSNLLMEVEMEERDNTQYIMPGNERRETCMEPADPEPEQISTIPGEQSQDTEIRRCNEYGCTFTGTTDEFLTHWNNEHISEVICLRCPICPKTFRKKASLQFHITHVHQSQDNDRDEVSNWEKHVTVADEVEDNKDDDYDDLQIWEQNQSLGVNMEDQLTSSAPRTDLKKSSLKSFAATETEYDQRPQSQQLTVDKPASITKRVDEGPPSKHIPTISGMGARNGHSSTLQTKSKQPSSSSSSAFTGALDKGYTPSSQTVVGTTCMPAAQPQTRLPTSSYIPPPLQNTASAQFHTPVYSQSVTPIMPPPSINIPDLQHVHQSVTPRMPLPSMTMPSQSIPETPNPPPLHLAIATASQQIQPAYNPYPPVGVPQSVVGETNVQPPSLGATRSIPFVSSAQLMRPVHPSTSMISHSEVTSSHIISAPPQLVNAQQQVTYAQSSSTATSYVQTTVQSGHMDQSSKTSVPSIYPGVTGTAKSADLADWYKKVTDSMLSNKTRDPSLHVKDRDGKNQKIDASVELIKSLQLDIVVAQRPNWPEKFKESAPLPSMKTIREKRKSPKKGPIFQVPSIVIPAFKRGTCESIKNFLKWSEIMIKRLEHGNIQARRKLKLELEDSSDGSEDETEAIGISSDEEAGDEEIEHADKKEQNSKTAEDALLEEMKKKAEEIAETLLKNFKTTSPKTNTLPTGVEEVNKPKGKEKSKVKETKDERQQFGKLVSRAMGMAKKAAKKASNGDVAMMARAMSWAKHKLINLKEKQGDLADDGAETLHAEAGNTGRDSHKSYLSAEDEIKRKAEEIATDLFKKSQISHKKSDVADSVGSNTCQSTEPAQHVEVYMDEQGKPNEEYTLAYIDEGGVHVMDDGYLLGTDGSIQQSTKGTKGAVQDFHKMPGGERDVNISRGQGRGNCQRQDRRGKGSEGGKRSSSYDRKFSQGNVRGQQVQESYSQSGRSKMNIRHDNTRAYGKVRENEMAMGNEDKFRKENRHFREERRGFDQEQMFEGEHSVRRNDIVRQNTRKSFRDDDRQIRNISTMRQRNKRNLRDSDRQEQEHIDFRHRGAFRNENRTHQRVDERRNAGMQEVQNKGNRGDGQLDYGGRRGERWNINRGQRQHEWNFSQQEMVSVDEDRGQEMYPEEEDERFTEEEFLEFREDDTRSRGERFAREEYVDFRDDDDDNDRMSRGSGRSSKHEFRRHADNQIQQERHGEKRRNVDGGGNLGRQLEHQFDRQNEDISNMHDQRIVQVVQGEFEDLPLDMGSDRVVQYMKYDDDNEMISDDGVSNFDRYITEPSRMGQYRRNDRNTRSAARGDRHDLGNERRGILAHERRGYSERREQSFQREDNFQTSDVRDSQWTSGNTGRSNNVKRAGSIGRSSSWSQCIDNKRERDGSNQGQGQTSKDRSSRREGSGQREKGLTSRKEETGRGRQWGRGVQQGVSWMPDSGSMRREEAQSYRHENRTNRNNR